MNKTEYLLATLAEECAESIQRAIKAMRFGLSEVEPGQPDDNKRRLEREVADVEAMRDMLGLVTRISDRDAKYKKVTKFMEYSRELGTLDPDPPQKAEAKPPLNEAQKARKELLCSGHAFDDEVAEEMVVAVDKVKELELENGQWEKLVRGIADRIFGYGKQWRSDGSPYGEDLMRIATELQRRCQVIKGEEPLPARSSRRSRTMKRKKKTCRHRKVQKTRDGRSCAKCGAILSLSRFLI